MSCTLLPHSSCIKWSSFITCRMHGYMYSQHAHLHKTLMQTLIMLNLNGVGKGSWWKFWAYMYSKNTAIMWGVQTITAPDTYVALLATSIDYSRQCPTFALFCYVHCSRVVYISIVSVSIAFTCNCPLHIPYADWWSLPTPKRSRYVNTCTALRHVALCAYSMKTYRFTCM